MVMRVQHVDGEFRVVLTPEAMEALHLVDGSVVEIQPAAAGVEDSGVKVRYVTVEEGLESFRRTEPQHQNTYRELAK